MELFTYPFCKNKKSIKFHGAFAAVVTTHMSVSTSKRKPIILFRHPDHSSRPSFEQLGEDLSEPETELLVWTVEDTRSHPHAMTIGAALEASKGLYSDLQQKYSSP